MFSILIFFLTLAAFDTVLFVNAGLFIVNPRRGSVCHGGKPCTVDWLDDGQNPLLSAVGVTTVGLYTGKQRLVQTIVPVDVSTAHSLTFIPRPEAGPNSGAYYISFISTTLKQNSSLPYAAFSPFFQLDKMTGSFTEPDPIATSSIAVPASVVKGAKTTDGNDVLTTITVGVLATSSTPTTITATSPASSSSTSPRVPSGTPSSTSKGAHTTATSSSSVTATPTSPASVPNTTASGFSTSVLLASSVSASANGTTLTVSSSSASSSSSSPSSTSSSKTNGGAAAGAGAPLKRTGFSVVFILIHLALFL